MLIGMNLIGTVVVVVVLCPAQFWTLVWVPLMELLEGLRLQVSDPMSKLRLKISGFPRKSLSAALFARYVFVIVQPATVITDCSRTSIVPSSRPVNAPVRGFHV